MFNNNRSSYIKKIIFRGILKELKQRTHMPKNVQADINKNILISDPVQLIMITQILQVYLNRN
jgi:hypothetical protein